MATMLENIKAGDTVIRRIYGDKTVEETVERTTKTQIILTNDRRYRRDGYRVGAGSLTDDYIEAVPTITAKTYTHTKKWNTYPKGSDRFLGPHVVQAQTRNEAKRKGGEYWCRRESEVTVSPRKS